MTSLPRPSVHPSREATTLRTGRWKARLLARSAALSVVWLLPLLQASPAAAQSASSLRPTFDLHEYPLVGGLLDDSLRLSHLTGAGQAGGYLLRSPLDLLPRHDGRPIGLEILVPMARGIWNSALPSAANGGSLWSGRGKSSEAGAGIRLRIGPLRGSIAPRYTYTENRDFVAFLEPTPSTSPWLQPWYRYETTLDRPYRFGEDPISDLHPGETSASVAAFGFEAGYGTESVWWGPGIRNAIVLSTNAPGFPHAFIRTTRPLRTPIGAFETSWLSGRLENSAYYDLPGAGSKRALGAFALTYAPWFEPDLALGFSRSVYGVLTEDQNALQLGRAVFTHWRSPLAPTDPYEQILSLFARWVLPSANAEVYGEWARQQLPASMRDLLIHPNHSQGYTVGGQWLSSADLSSAFRVQAEITNLEMSTTFRTDRRTSFYVSPQWGYGYTNAGRVIGAAIGPGSSSQWLAIDYLGPGWRLGPYVNRTRWDNDAFYGAPGVVTSGWPFLKHDVSVLGGLRAAYVGPGFRLEVEASTEQRMNYHFQNWATGWDSAASDAYNVLNHSLRTVLSIRP